MRPKGSSSDLETRRLEAARLLRRGMSLSEVARTVGASPSSVHRWKQVLAKSGKRGLKAKRHTGPKPQLSPSQRRALKDFIRKGILTRSSCRLFGWACVKEIQGRFGVVYQTNHIGRLLRSLGLSSEELLDLGFYGKKLRAGC